MHFRLKMVAVYKGVDTGVVNRVHRLTATFLLYVRALILIVDDSFLRTGYLVMFIVVG